MFIDVSWYTPHKADSNTSCEKKCKNLQKLVLKCDLISTKVTNISKHLISKLINFVSLLSIPGKHAVQSDAGIMLTPGF